MLQTTHIRHKRRVHYASLQPLEVDVFEERVGLDAHSSVRLAPQPLLRVFGQQLGVSRCRDDSLHYSLFIHLSVQTTFPSNPHHSTDGLGVLCKLVVVLFFFFLHPSLYLLTLHTLLAGTKGGSSSGHLVNETTQPPPVRTHAVLFIVYHLRSWRDWDCVVGWTLVKNLGKSTLLNVLWIWLFLTHIANCPYPPSDEFSFRHFDGQPQVRNTDVSWSKR